MRHLALTALVACAFVGGAIACGDGSRRADDSIVLPDRTDAEGGADGRADTSVAPTDAGAETATDAGPDGAACTGCERLVFVTSTTYNGNLGGLAGANGLCQIRALASTSAAIKARTFVAWLGTPTETAFMTHVHGTGLYRRSDLAIVANSFTDLTDMSLATALQLDELGAVATGKVWTGTNGNGSSSASTCDSWTSADVGVIGQQGLAESVGNAWTDDTTSTCDTVARLYCIER